MQKFKEKAASSTLRKGLTVAASTTRKVVKALAPVDVTTEGITARGLYKASIGQKVRVRMARKRGYALVGARRGFRAQIGVRKNGKPIIQDPAKIGHLIEYGHGGPAPAPAKPHLRPGYEIAKRILTTAVAKAAEEDLRDAAAR